MGKILGRAAALHDGRHAALTEDYGPEKTGGWSRADLVISDDVIGYPIIEKPGVFVALSQDGFERFRSSMDEETTLIIESELVKLPASSELRAHAIPAMRSALSLGKKVVANIVMMGAVVEFTRAVSPQAVQKALGESVPKGTEGLNERAFEEGRLLAREASP